MANGHVIYYILCCGLLGQQLVKMNDGISLWPKFALWPAAADKAKAITWLQARIAELKQVKIDKGWRTGRFWAGGQSLGHVKVKAYKSQNLAAADSNWLNQRALEVSPWPPNSTKPQTASIYCMCVCGCVLSNRSQRHVIKWFIYEPARQTNKPQWRETCDRGHDNLQQRETLVK